MATILNTPSRRALLGAFIAAPLAALPIPSVAVAITLPDAGWTAQLALCRQLRAATEAPGASYSEDEFADLVDRMTAAEDDLIDMPAPDMRALAQKLEVLLVSYQDSILPPEQRNMMLADARRLAS